jgi:hypothetical protein
MTYTANRVPRVLMSLLLTAALVSCRADALSPRDKLTAQKEHLISKLSDSIAKFALLNQFFPSVVDTENLEGLEKEKARARLIEIGLMSLCGALESKDETIAKVLSELKQRGGNEPLLLSIQQWMIDAREMSRGDFFSLLALLKGEDEDMVNDLGQLEEEALAKLDIVLGDITDLLKVVKQIRELK